MRRLRVEVAFDAGADLAESPWWDANRAELLWVDLFAGEIHRLNPVSGRDRSLAIGQPVGMVAGRRSGGVVCAVRDGVGFADLDEDTFALVVPIESSIVGNRMNDGACDAAGRLWAGTMATDLAASAGTLYCVTPELVVTPMLSHISISNGLDWSPDGRNFYFIDSPTRRVDVCDFEIATGEIRNRQTLVHTPNDDAIPDGMAVDLDGTLWVAMWDGGCVRRYSSSGELIEIVELPVTRVTSVAFGGSQMDQLFITTARNGLSPKQLHNEPLAGAIFVVEPKVKGQSPHLFGR